MYVICTYSSIVETTSPTVLRELCRHMVVHEPSKFLYIRQNNNHFSRLGFLKCQCRSWWYILWRQLREDKTCEDASWAELIVKCAFCLCTWLSNHQQTSSQARKRFAGAEVERCIGATICEVLNAWQCLSLLVRSLILMDTFTLLWHVHSIRSCSFTPDW